MGTVETERNLERVTDAVQRHRFSKFLTPNKRVRNNAELAIPISNYMLLGFFRLPSTNRVTEAVALC